MKNTIKLQPESILQVPLHIYADDFTFIVNNEEYRTNKLVADLLSPSISNQHRVDPTFSEFTLNTQSSGDFRSILDLVNFEEKEIEATSFIFVSEVVNILGTSRLDVKIKSDEITLDNVVELVSIHEASKSYYSTNLSREIDFISERFSEVKKHHEKELLNLSSDSLERIITNKKLKLDNENDLLTFINELCIQNSEYSKFYEYVYFSNIDEKTMLEFVMRFDPSDMTHGVWKSLSRRLLAPLKPSNHITSRYQKSFEKIEKKTTLEIPYTMSRLEGIFSYLWKQSNIDDEVNVTYSSRVAGDTHLLLQIENANNDFYTESQPNSWICFEFKKFRIAPTNYSIRSVNSWTGDHHPKTWVVEGSEDGEAWVTLDKQDVCAFLNGANLVHTFSVQGAGEVRSQGAPEEFRFVRMRLTGPNWYNFDHLDICSIEFYGRLTPIGA